MDLIATMLQIRIEATREVIRRSRLTVLASIIVSLSLCIASFNAHESWYRDWTLNNDNWSESDVIRKLQETVYEEWARSRFISIVPLGIQVGTRDAVFLGAFALLIISAWSFGCVRRHTLVIRQLLLDTETDPGAVRRTVYHGIACQRLYGEVSGVEEPRRRLDGVAEPPSAMHLFQRQVRWLPFLPAVTIGLLLLMDVRSLYYIQAPLRDGRQPLAVTLCENAARKLRSPIPQSASSSPPAIINCDANRLRITWQLFWISDPRAENERSSITRVLVAWICVFAVGVLTSYFGYRTTGLEAGVDADLTVYHKTLYPITPAHHDEDGQAGERSD